MYKISGLLVAAVIFYSCSSTKVNSTKVSSMSTSPMSTSTDNTLNEQEKSDGWQLLFDGKTFDGWHSYGRSGIGPLWAVKDSSFYLDSDKKKSMNFKGDDYLITNEDYDNFHLKIDWKISQNGNSGIIFYAKEDTAKYDVAYKTGLEYQVLDNNGHPDAKIVKHRAGDLYDLVVSKEMVKPAGEWNYAEIISNKGKLEFYLNGQQTLSTTLWDDSWRNMVAGSKFKDMPDFGIFKTGKIALQDHGDNVWFRNIRIKRL